MEELTHFPIFQGIRDPKIRKSLNKLDEIMCKNRYDKTIDTTGNNPKCIKCKKRFERKFMVRVLHGIKNPQYFWYCISCNEKRKLSLRRRGSEVSESNNSRPCS